MPSFLSVEKLQFRLKFFFCMRKNDIGDEKDAGTMKNGLKCYQIVGINSLDLKSICWEK